MEPLEPRQLLAGLSQDSGDDGPLANFTNYYPTVHSQTATASFLSAPAAGDSLSVGLAYLKQNVAALGLSSSDVDKSAVTNRYVDSGTGITHIYLQQTYGGLPVEAAYADVNLMPDGRVITAGASYVSGLNHAAAPTSFTPTVTAAAALNAVASGAGLSTANINQTQPASGLNQRTVFTSSALSTTSIPVQLEYVPNSSGGIDLAWTMTVMTPDLSQAFKAEVAAAGPRAGQIVRVENMKLNLADYNVFPQSPIAVQDPLFGNRSIVFDPQNAVASPFGWHDTNFLPGPESFTTIGNNVTAIPDPSLGVPPPNGGPTLDFNFPFTPGVTGAPQININAAVTNLFYWLNIGHDINYIHGFDEAAGNYQQTNRSSAGLGGDPIVGTAQYTQPANLNNAFLVIAPEGQSSHINMGLFNTTATGGTYTPSRDSDFDGTVILHETTHGTSTRLTGGPANVFSLQALQSSGMGEGWSDWFALTGTINPTDTAVTPRTIGDWITNGTTAGPGVRRQPYSYDMSIDPLTFNNYNGDSFPQQNNSEEHNSGEIWATTLWDLTWNLIAKYGRSNDLYSHSGGQNKAIDLVFQAMKLQPANPSFTQARDAILSADFVLNAGANYELIWQTFARRGLGASTIDPGASVLNIFPAFDSPLPAGRVQGTVFNDINNNQRRDTAEPPLANVVVYDDGNNNGVLDSNELQTTTDANGFYSLAFVVSQTVHVRQALSPAYTQTFPVSSGGYTVQISPNQTVTGKDFGDLATPGMISGSKFNDLDGNGLRDPGEPGIQGVTVYVDLNGDGKISLGEPAAVTDYFGNYTIRGVAPGTNYVVREVATPGGLQTVPGAFAAPVPYAWSGVAVQPGIATTGINFGNTLSLDYGDAPDSYGTSLSHNGARAGLLAGFGLGLTVAGKPDGIPSILANTDLNDDGVVLTSAGITPGTTASIRVAVNSSGFSPGKLQAWVDFNLNGKFDANEKIISNLLLPTGVYNFSFAVPANTPLGTTYARFRYGYEPDLGPTGPSIAGEVEDYALTVLPSVPIANPDSFVVSSTQATPLDVLANDTATAFGPLQIVGTDFPKTLPSGTVTFDAVNNRLLFTPNTNTIVPGGSDTFTYSVTDGHSTSSPGTVTLNFDIRAVDDTFNVNPTTDLVTPGDINSGVQKTLLPLANDRSANAAGTVITAVVPETLNTAATATLSPDGKSVVFRAPANFHGTVIFDYTIQDTGNPATTTPSTARMTVQVSNGTPAVGDTNYLAELDVSITDLNGNPVAAVHQGDQFQLHVTSQDLRSGGTAANRGVTSAYLDLLLNELLDPPAGSFVQYVTPVVDANNPRGFNIQFGAAYNGGIRSGTYLPTLNLVNEVGTSISAQITGAASAPPGPGVIPVFTILMQANSPTPAGIPVKPASLVGDPADNATLPVEIMTEDGARTMAISDEQVYLGAAAITVLPPLAGGEGEFINLQNPLDVNSDKSISPSDALTVINTLNAIGSQSLKSLTSAQIPGLVDTNMDSMLSPVDALTVINYINSQSANRPASQPLGEGEAQAAGAEGEGGAAIGGDLAPLGALSSPAAGGLSTAQSSAPSLLVQTSSTAIDSPAGAGPLVSSKPKDDSPLGVDPSAADELYADLFLSTADNGSGSNLS